MSSEPSPPTDPSQLEVTTIGTLVNPETPRRLFIRPKNLPRWADQLYTDLESLMKRLQKARVLQRKRAKLSIGSPGIDGAEGSSSSSDAGSDDDNASVSSGASAATVRLAADDGELTLWAKRLQEYVDTASLKEREKEEYRAILTLAKIHRHLPPEDLSWLKKRVHTLLTAALYGWSVALKAHQATEARSLQLNIPPELLHQRSSARPSTSGTSRLKSRPRSRSKTKKTKPKTGK